MDWRRHLAKYANPMYRYISEPEEPKVEDITYRPSFRDFIPSMAISLLTDTANFFHEKYFSLLGHIHTAVENLAIPSHAEVQKLASTSLSPVKAEEYLRYLKTFYEFLLKFRSHNLATEDHIVNCNMDTLLDFHMVSKETRAIASKLVCEAYGTFDACLKSNKLVNVLLFLAHRLHVRDDVTTIFELPSEENWLQRNVLHIVAIFVHEQEILRFIPKVIIKRFINAKDLHGCTPLHVAYLHENEQVVQFLLCNGATEDIADDFGLVPKPAEPNFAVLEYKKLCCEITESSGDTFRKMKPMLIMSPAQAEDQAVEMEKFLEHLTRNTEYCQSVEKIVVAGSLRDKLKVGLLDEADVQVRFKSSLFDIRSINDNLIQGLKTMNWEDIHLRPICMTNPWVLQWEKPGPLQGIKVSVDVVPIFETGFIDHRSFPKQRQILPFAKMHEGCYFLKLKRVEEGLCNTYFSYEWDILDQVSMACRLGILIAKALLQAYYVAKGLDQSPLKKPITSYMVKTAVFYILAREKSQDADHKDAFIITTVFPKRTVKWIGEEDLEKHAEEGRVWAIKIFETIMNECCRGGIKYYWNDELYLVKGDEGKDVIKLCMNLLERLELETFYNKLPKAALGQESSMVGWRESVATTSCNERQTANERWTHNIDHLDQTKPHQSQCKQTTAFRPFPAAATKPAHVQQTGNCKIKRKGRRVTSQKLDTRPK